MDESAVLVVDSGATPSGENVVRWETVAEPPPATVTSQLSKIALSSRVAQMHVFGPAACAPICDHIVLYLASMKLLPEVSGFELLGEWRANPRTADLPVFILTSMDLTKEEQGYLRMHAESLFRKQEPWQEELLKQLERAVSLGAPEKV